LKKNETIIDNSFEAFLCRDDGTFPNNNFLAAIIYQQVFVAEPSVNPATIEKLFGDNDWPGAWRNGLYREHHYHSTAHEALGIYSGWVKAQLGGPEGKMVVAGAGDVIIIPAGVSHRNIEQSQDFKVVGAYPIGQVPDMRFGQDSDRPVTDENIRNVSLPGKDPVFGSTGAVISLWG